MKAFLLAELLPYSMFMCHPWQQYLEHLKLERLLGSSVVVGLAIKRAHKYLRHVGFTLQSVGRYRSNAMISKRYSFLGSFVKNLSFLSLRVHR